LNKVQPSIAIAKLTQVSMDLKSLTDGQLDRSIIRGMIKEKMREAENLRFGPDPVSKFWERTS
jgi:hypothetical protein